jgi:hypothetical protein
MSKVTCPNVENPESQSDQFVLRIFNIWTSNPWHGRVSWSMESSDCKDMKKYKWEGYFPGTLFWGFWRQGWPLKRLKWQKPLEMG